MIAKVARGIVVGLVGTSWMTAAQELVGGSESASDEEPSWDKASSPAQVARKALLAVGVDPPPSWIPFLTHAVHWGYGTTWGVLYTLVRGDSGRGTFREGVAFGTLVWGSGYVQLVPLGIFEPPWKYDAKTIATDLGYHLAFGIGVATAADATRS